MKRKWQQGCRGAISVFLIIIFLMQYVFCGLLVDGARQKMAEAMAESALDSAATSVLSYYNQLLFDLYGLMGTDGLSEEKINEKLKHYVECTLGISTVDPTSIKSLVNTVMDAFEMALGETPDGSAFDGYDFQVTVSGTPAVNLSNSDFVEYQLIEHMKYRAPMYMLQSEDGFLSKLKGLADIKERVKAAADRMEVTNAYAQVGEAAAGAMTSIAELSQQVRGYISSPSDPSIRKETSPVSIENVLTYASDFDERIEEAIEDYRQRQDDYESELDAYQDALQSYYDTLAIAPDAAGFPPTEPEAPEPWTAEDWKDALSADFRDMKNKYANVMNNAETLKIAAENQINNIDTIVGNGSSHGAGEKSYGAYINSLKSKCGENGGEENANAATVFLPEIELAQANAGQLLKNRPFLTCVTTFTGDILDSRGELEGQMETAFREIITQLSHGGDDPSFTSMSSRLSSGRNYLSGMTGGLNQLNYALSDALIVSPAQVDVRTGSVNTKKAKDEIQTENPGDDLRNIKEENLKVNFTADDSPDPGDFKMDDSADSASGLKLLKAAASLVDTLMELLESSRDSLYLNQYIVSYFPNYVDNFKKTDSASDLTKKFNSGGSYAPYCASQAEVEYVLTGQPDGKLNVMEVQAMLLGIRTAFNLIAIFTDAAKINQANAIAAAISGPFAPAVAIALLIAWATAESVMDVNNLCNGEKVPLFKQGNEWTFSVEGAVEKGISAGVDYLAGEAKDKVTDLASSVTGQVKNVADQAVYKAYEALETGRDGLNEASSTINSWANNITRGLSLSTDPSAAQLSTAILGIKNGIQDNIFTPVSGLIDRIPPKDKTLLQVSKATEKVDSIVSDKVSALGDHLSEKLTSTLSSWVSDKIPVGSVVSLEGTPAEDGGSLSVDMSYIDYIQIFLLLKGNTKKTQRIQELIQANMRFKEVDGDPDKVGTYLLEESYGAIQATLTGSIRFLFMSEPIVPADLRQNGRLKFAVNSSASY